MNCQKLQVLVDVMASKGVVTFINYSTKAEVRSIILNNRFREFLLDLKAQNIKVSFEDFQTESVEYPPLEEDSLYLSSVGFVCR